MTISGEVQDGGLANSSWGWQLPASVIEIWSRKSRQCVLHIGGKHVAVVDWLRFDCSLTRRGYRGVGISVMRHHMDRVRRICKMLLLQLLLVSGHRSGVSGRRRIHRVGVVKLGDMRCNDLALPFLSGVQDQGQKEWF